MRRVLVGFAGWIRETQERSSVRCDARDDARDRLGDADGERLGDADGERLGDADGERPGDAMGGKLGEAAGESCVVVVVAAIDAVVGDSIELCGIGTRVK
jgi:hypothetical protein